MDALDVESRIAEGEQALPALLTVVRDRAGPREPTLRQRDYGWRFGTCAVARPCDRTPGEPGSVALDAPAN